MPTTNLDTLLDSTVTDYVVTCYFVSYDRFLKTDPDSKTSLLVHCQKKTVSHNEQLNSREKKQNQNQGDQMSLLKNCPKCGLANFFSKFLHNFHRRKKVGPPKWDIFLFLINWPKKTIAR
jgi:hypothetical protein